MLSLQHGTFCSAPGHAWEWVALISPSWGPATAGSYDVPCCDTSSCPVLAPGSPSESLSQGGPECSAIMLGIMHSKRSLAKPLSSWGWVLAHRERLVLERVRGLPCFYLHHHPGICRALHHLQMERRKSCKRNAGAPRRRWPLEA